MEISNEDLDELLSCISSLVDMMEPYYSQCNGAAEAYEIIEKYRRRQPHITKSYIGASCKICGKTFERSAKNKLMDANQQDGALTNHLITFHGISDHKERKKYKEQSKVVVKHWDTYQEYLDSEIS